MRADLSVIGFSQEVPRRIAASATRYEVGEPLHGLGVLSSGAINTNTFVLAAADTPVIGTHRFGGIAMKNPLPFNTGTLVAHTTIAKCPIPWLGRIRGKGEIAANVDTDTEILGLIGDATLIDYNSTGAPDGGELYTIKDVASADTSGLEIAEGNPAKGTLDVYVDGRSYRHDVS
jgi:hypothetical protein